LSASQLSFSRLHASARFARFVSELTGTTRRGRRRLSHRRSPRALRRAIAVPGQATRCPGHSRLPNAALKWHPPRWHAPRSLPTVSHPRRVVPGETYLITRRCYQRTFRLRPRRETNDIFAYCLALAMRATGVRLHAACVMSNHHHLVVTDPRGVLPDFLRELHRLTAKAMNASQGQWENLWAAEPCNVVRLATDDDVDDKVAYVVANPVAAGLVRSPEAWPGLLLSGATVLRVARPSAYFTREGVCPPDLTLTVEPPPTRGDEPITRESRAQRLQRFVREKVAAAHAAMRAAGRGFLGVDAVLSTSFARRAKSYETKCGTIPTFAARVAVVREHLRRVERGFRVQYRRALRVWRTGVRDVVFPEGTWWLRVFHGAVAVESGVG
jgi:putative transposase